MRRVQKYRHLPIKSVLRMNNKNLFQLFLSLLSLRTLKIGLEIFFHLQREKKMINFFSFTQISPKKKNNYKKCQWEDH